MNRFEALLSRGNVFSIPKTSVSSSAHPVISDIPFINPSARPTGPVRLLADEVVPLKGSEPKPKKKSHKANKGDKDKPDKKSSKLKTDSKVTEATGTSFPGTQDMLWCLPRKSHQRLFLPLLQIMLPVDHNLPVNSTNLLSSSHCLWTRNLPVMKGPHWQMLS